MCVNFILKSEMYYTVQFYKVENPKPKIGFDWIGNPKAKDDHKR